MRVFGDWLVASEMALNHFVWCNPTEAFPRKPMGSVRGLAEGGGSAKSFLAISVVLRAARWQIHSRSILKQRLRELFGVEGLQIIRLLAEVARLVH